MIPALLIALSVQAEPRMLELGTHTTARLRIDSPSPPRLAVNVGAIKGLREESPGKWVADYVPPRPTYPASGGSGSGAAPARWLPRRPLQPP